MRKRLFILFFLLTILSCKSNLIICNIKTENIPNSEKITLTDSSIVRLVDPYKSNMEAEMQEVIGFSTIEMVKDKPESELTNYLSDLMLEESRIYAEKTAMESLPAVAYLNYGGIRSGLPKGNITVREIFGLMPFENEVVLLKLTAKDMESFINRIASRGGDCISGIRMAISNGKAKTIEIEGKPLDYSAEYWIVTNDYVANGGDSMDMLGRRLEYVETGMKIRDCIINNMRKNYQAGKQISPELDGRIYLID